MSFRNLRKGQKIAIIVPVAITFIGLLSLVVMLLWNAIIADVFDIGKLSYWQALGLLLLSKILFGFGPRYGRSQHFRRHSLRRKWMKMSEEERQKFREIWKERCGRKD